MCTGVAEFKQDFSSRSIADSSRILRLLSDLFRNYVLFKRPLKCCSVKLLFLLAAVKQVCNVHLCSWSKVLCTHSDYCIWAGSTTSRGLHIFFFKYVATGGSHKCLKGYYIESLGKLSYVERPDLSLLLVRLKKFVWLCGLTSCFWDEQFCAVFLIGLLIMQSLLPKR